MRLDEAMNQKGLVQSRSQAERLIKLGKVQVSGQVVKKPGTQYKRGEIHIKDDEK